MQINAAIVREQGTFSVETLELDAPQSNEVLVRIVGTGLCHTDLAVRDQHIPLPLPAVLGHEGAGVVEKVGSAVTTLEPGDHVVMSFGACGHCQNCIAGRPANCLNFVQCNVGTRRLDGSCTHHQHGEPLTSSFFAQSSFGTYALAEEHNVVKVPSDIPVEMLGPLGCGIQTGAGAVLNVLKPRPGSSIAIFGAGAVGLSAIMAAKICSSAQIVAVDVIESRLELAKELGATHVVNGRECNAVEAIQSQIPGGVDFAIEATGIPEVVTQAFDALSQTGSLVVLGVAPDGATLQFDAASLLGGKTVQGSYEGDSNPRVFIPELIELYRRGVFPIDKLMRYYPLEQINEAAADCEKGVTIKPVLLMG